MDKVKEYINSHLNRLSGCFKIYVNKENKFLHVSEKAKIKVDLNFWKHIKTLDKWNQKIKCLKCI